MVRFFDDAEIHELLETCLSSAKAAIAVILVLLYGFLLRKYQYLSPQGESNVSKIGTTFLLPALLFTEIGPLATWANLKNYWPIIPLSLIFQLIALGTGEVSKAFGMPQHYVPIFVFNNVTSLPLLLITALASTGSLDAIVRPGEALADVLKRGRVYILINALVGNLTRFALGPYLMQTHKPLMYLHAHVDDPSHDPSPSLPKVGAVRLPADSAPSASLPHTDADGPVLVNPGPKSTVQKVGSGLRKAGEWVVIALNPPLVGGAAAIFFGLIPWFHTQLFTTQGWLTPVADSVASTGNLYTALQMLILGAHLYSKKGSKANPFLLSWLFLYRFVLAPAISITIVWGIRKQWPHLMDDDPILDFVLMISNVGPPALTLSAIAEMAHLTADVEGQISRIITLSYALTPLISLGVTAAITVVQKSRGL